MDNIREILASNLAREREKRKLTQKQAAAKAKISHNSLSNYENGKRIPPADALCKLANVYNVSMDYLCGRTQIPDVAHKVNITNDVKYIPDKKMEILRACEKNPLLMELIPLIVERGVESFAIVLGIINGQEAAGGA